jgi:hypothetical protein
LKLTEFDLDVLYTLQHVAAHERPTAHQRHFAALARRGLVKGRGPAAQLTDRGRRACARQSS